MVGVEGALVMVTTSVPARDVQPPTVTVTLYVPPLAEVVLVIDGFCNDDAKAEGPVQE
jgi:hypothetical protein